MQAYKFQGTIDPSGHLVIHDPIAMPPGDVEVIMWPSETSIRSNSGEFLPGEFAQLFHSALETINLTLHAGVNWTAFAHSINRINADYKTAQLGIQSIENKGDGIILLKLSTAPGSDTVQIHRDFMQIYEETKQTLENRRQLNTRDTLLGHNAVDSIHPRESINQLFELLNPGLGGNIPRSTPLFNRIESSAVSTTELSVAATTMDAATILSTLLHDLAQRYPDATHAQRLSVTALEIQQKSKIDMRFRAKLIEAAQSSSLLIDQVLVDNPFVPVSFDTIREWLEIDVRSLSVPFA
jgi:hypothetical protein